MALGRINLTQEVSKIFKMNTQKQGRRFVDSGKSTANRRLSRRERKLALLQDVDKLKKKLSHEESVHRALQRAFTRPLGSLPRLPPYLPPHTLALLAEVAVLEEEVVRLEEQVVNFRQGLYEESFSVSSSKRIKENPIISSSDTSTSQSVHESSPTMQMPIPLPIVSPRLAPSPGVSRNRSTWITNERQASRRTLSFDDTRNKENYSDLNMTRNNKQSHKPIEAAMAQSSTEKLRFGNEECTLVEQGSAREDFLVIPEETASSSPNKISEDILKCLFSILLRMSRNTQSNTFSSVIRLPSQENREQVATRDPYGICKEYGQRDIGPYKNLRVIEANSIDSNRKTNSLFLLQRLKILLGKLASVEIQGLTHLQKLAFWINVYNSCMMNAFLEHGIPNSPQKIIMLMQKAIINVGGESLNAMTIEHFILRLPHHLKSTQNIPGEHEVRRKQTHLGLEWSEPLVTFALSCGSWSSPADNLESTREDLFKLAKKIFQSRNKELDRAVSLPLAEESRKPNGYRRPGDSDEDLARALQESLNTSSCPPYASQNFSRGYRLCGGCKHEIGSGNYLGCMGAFWHPECFCCHACGYPITEHEFSLSGRNPYHKSCFKEIYHPKCEVCHQFYRRLFLGLGHGAKRPEDLNATIYARMKLTRRGAGSASDKPLDAKTLRRLAHNREAARKSRLRKKAYVQQLETSRLKLRSSKVYAPLSL